MVQPTSPHLPKTLEFSFFPSFVPCSIVLYLCSSAAADCSRLCILAKVSLTPLGLTPPAGSKWESRQPPSVRKRLQFHFSAAQGRCFLHVPYACRDADTAAQHHIPLEAPPPPFHCKVGVGEFLFVSEGRAEPHHTRARHRSRRRRSVAVQRLGRCRRSGSG